MSWLPSFKRSSSSASTSTSNTTTSSSTKSKRHQIIGRMSSQSHHPQDNHAYLSSSSAEEIQHAAIQEPSRPTTSRETGFPEPLNPDRNTTLPHPSADTSPNATIIAPDLVNAHNSRSRSFLRKRSHSNKVVREVEIANGTVTTLPMVDPGKMYEGIEYADGSKESGGNAGVVNALGNLSPGGSSESGGKNSMSSEEERDRKWYVPGQKKRGLLTKRALHKV